MHSQKLIVSTAIVAAFNFLQKRMGWRKNIVKLTGYFISSCLFTSCHPASAVINNRLDRSITIEMVTTSCSKRDLKILPWKSFPPLASPEYFPISEEIAFLRITNGEKTWNYSHSDLIRMAQGKQGFQIWEVQKNGLSLKAND